MQKFSDLFNSVIDWKQTKMCIRDFSAENEFIDEHGRRAYIFPISKAVDVIVGHLDVARSSYGTTLMKDYIAVDHNSYLFSRYTVASKLAELNDVPFPELSVHFLLAAWGQHGLNIVFTIREHQTTSWPLISCHYAVNVQNL